MRTQEEINALAKFMHRILYKNNPLWDDDTMINKEWLLNLSNDILLWQQQQKYNNRQSKLG